MLRTSYLGTPWSLIDAISVLMKVRSQGVGRADLTLKIYQSYFEEFEYFGVSLYWCLQLQFDVCLFSTFFWLFHTRLIISPFLLASSFSCLDCTVVISYVTEFSWHMLRYSKLSAVSVWFLPGFHKTFQTHSMVYTFCLSFVWIVLCLFNYRPDWSKQMRCQFLNQSDIFGIVV